MGATRATEMIEFVGQEAALRDHFTHGCYPPIDIRLLPVAREAIERAADCDWLTEIDVLGLGTAQVAKLVEAMHLQPFVYAAREEEVDE